MGQIGTGTFRDDLEVWWAKQAVGVGLFTIFIAGLPVSFAGRSIDLANLANRYTLAPMFGAVILAVGLVELLINTRLQRAIIISIIVGLAIGFHFRNANLYRRDWIDQRNIIWQLNWRAPELSPGTSVFAIDPPISSLFLRVDYALSMPLNFT